jgi:RNA polymerase sigma-70 factor (sigma-E family)
VVGCYGDREFCRYKMHWQPELAEVLGVGNGNSVAVFADISLSVPTTVANVMTRTVLNLYTEHYGAMVRLAYVVVSDVAAAEEIVQDTFLAMLTGSWQLREEEKALAYLRQAIVNRSRSVVRHQIVVDKHLQKHSPDMPSAEHGALTLLERDAVVSALRELTERQREAVVLRYYAGLSEAETADAMGISPGSVKSHVSRAMVSLRETLEPQLI